MFSFFRVRIILVHYEFESFKGWHRRGNSKDVENLKNAFKKRGIPVDEYSSMPKDEVLKTLSGEKNLPEEIAGDPV